MTYRRERPQCRKVLVHLMKEYDCNLEGLLHHPTMFMSDGLRVQAHKMLAESEFKSAKELEAERCKIAFRRAVGLIK